MPYLLVVTPEPILPANHGGRVDQWNRWSHLKRMGWSLDILTWDDASEPVSVVGSDLNRVFNRAVSLRRANSLGKKIARLPLLAKFPAGICSRFIDSKSISVLAKDLSATKYDAIFLDGLYGGQLAVGLAKALKIPLLYRSHNIEHQYMNSQMRASRTLGSKFRLILANLHLREFEENIHRSATRVFDISISDIEYWSSRRHSTYVWAPPLLSPVDIDKRSDDRPAAASHDFVYLGNLNTPNNVAGLIWFCDDVLPRIREQRPDATVLIGGSRPVPELVEHLQRIPNVDLEANPSDAAPFRLRGRVLVNPVPSGSGVNVKSIEMLATPRPIVTTRVAVQGLDRDALNNYLIADDAAPFAEACLKALTGVPIDPTLREKTIAFYSSEGARRLSQEIELAISPVCDSLLRPTSLI